MFIAYRFRILAILLTVAFPPLRPMAQGAEQSTLKAALLSIRANDLKAHVNVLADDTFEGREAGSRGGRAAGGYLASHLQKAGLRGGGDAEGYFQQFGTHRNVLAVLEGSDPVLKNEFIILGAHYDHVGYGNARNSYGPTGYIHNGADDNASGTASLLELADAFASLPVPPKRSILFAFWDGEEAGLLGSKHWISRPTIPKDRIAFAFNIDMLGRLRNNRIEILGNRTSYGLRKMVSRHNQEIGLELDFTWEMTANSDHYTFASNNIPVLMPFTGLHEDYHRPSDDAEKINNAGMERVVRLLFLVSQEIAEVPDRFTFRANALRETPVLRQQFEKSQPAAPPRLGVSWKVRDPFDGLELTRVDRQSPADQAGLRVGDRIVNFAEAPITDENQFRIALLAARSPAHFGIVRVGETLPQTVSVPIVGQPIRLGVTWREDDAEPGTIFLTQVVNGSAAQQAGLRERDRVYEVGGRIFKNADEFRALITTLPTPIEMLIERNGRMSTVQLAVPPVATE